MNVTTENLFTDFRIDTFDPESGEVYIRNLGGSTIRKDTIVIYLNDKAVQILYSEDIPPKQSVDL